MKIKKCIFMKKILMLSLLYVSGCTMQYNLPSNYQLPEGGSTGVSVITLRCLNLGPDKVSGGTLYWEGNNFLASLINNPNITFKCDGSKQVFFLKLPADKYQVVDFIASPYSISAANFKGISFKVEPGKVTYVGNLIIRMKDNNFSFSVQDNSSVDIPMIKSRLPNVSVGKYSVELMQINK